MNLTKIQRANLDVDLATKNDCSYDISVVEKRIKRSNKPWDISILSSLKKRQAIYNHFSKYMGIL